MAKENMGVDGVIGYPAETKYSYKFPLLLSRRRAAASDLILWAHDRKRIIRTRMTSEEICHFEYDNHLVSTDGAWFDANHFNL
jgi:hypothetical protein